MLNLQETHTVLPATHAQRQAQHGLRDNQIASDQDTIHLRGANTASGVNTNARNTEHEGILQTETAAAAGLVILRCGVALSFLLHGIEKRRYWHLRPGGGNSAAMLRLYRFLSVAEPLGAIALLTGFLARAAAAGTALIMMGAIRTRIVKWGNGWGEDDGWEIDGILLSASLAIVCLGPGAWSVDHLLGWPIA